MSQCDICQRTVTYTVRLDLPAIDLTGREDMYVCGACQAGLATLVEPYAMMVRSFYAHLDLSVADIEARKARIAEARQQFRFVHCSEFGISGETLNVYSRRNHGRLIGYISGWEVMNFLAGDPTHFLPVDNWQNTFSVDLIERLGLQR